MRASSTGRLPGRFLPGDPRVEEPYRLTPQVALRVAILGFLALGVFAVLFLRLWALQVLAGSRYLVDANNNRVRTLHLDAPRGAIVDTNGHVLVKNVLGIGLELWPADMPKGKAARRREIEAIAVVAAMPVKEILARMAVYENDPLTPVVLRRGIHDDQISYFKEHQLQFPGVHLAQSYLRKYPFESLAAQTLGHVGAITPDQLKEARKAGYRSQDVMGQAGIERSFDKYLRGTDGLAQLTVDSRGTPTSQVQSRALPVPGNTLRLTIDIGLQRAAERALRFGIQTARATGDTYANGGAIVALNPRTGAVLALASNPTYEPSVYVGRDPDKLAPLQDDAAAAAKNYPGINRALSSVYPPGSVWKPVTAFAAIGENLVTPTQAILCSSSFEFYGQTFTNWDPDVNRWMELPQALAESCDTYFYRLGVGFYDLPSARGPTLQNWALRLGFGAKTGIEVGPEASGLVPTPTWRCKHFGGPPCKGYVDRIWKPGYEIQLTIGQGDLEVTPIQMARLYALIANGGNLVTPHIGQDIEAPAASGGRAQVLRELFTQQPFKSGIDPTAILAVQQGLYAATHSTLGTSYGVFGQFPVAIAGKTGTAEKLVRIPGYPNPLKLNQSWWCGYGPYEQPTIALCTVIENGGHGGGVAALASLRVFEAYFKKRGIVTSHITD